MKKFVIFLLFSLVSSKFFKHKKIKRKLNTDTGTEPVQTENVEQIPEQPSGNAQPQHSYSCDRKLLRTFQLWFEPKAHHQNNLFCPLIKKNCCSHYVQVQVYKKWVVNKERVKLLDLYKSYTDVFSQIFDKFFQIQKFAQQTTKHDQHNPCDAMSDALINIDLTTIKTELLKQMNNAFKFLYYSRRGFYCSICDGELQKFYLHDMDEIQMPFTMCNSLIQNMLPYLTFRYNEFFKISRIFALYLKQCDAKNVYDIKKHLKHEQKFFKQKEIYDQIEKCHNGIKLELGLDSCLNICNRFNPVKYDEYFEGRLEILKFFNLSLSGMIDKRLELTGNSKIKEELFIKKRILEEKKEEKPKEKTDENVEGQEGEKKEEEKVELTPEEKYIQKNLNEIHSFNEQFQYYLLGPLSYEYNEGHLHVQQPHLENRIFSMDIREERPLQKYTALYQPEGINYFQLGRIAQFNKEKLTELGQLIEEEISKNEEPVENQEGNEVEKTDEKVVEENVENPEEKKEEKKTEEKVAT